MKMVNAGDVAISAYSQYVYNCTLKRCQRSYVVPLPNSEAMQLYVWFGAEKPTSWQMWAIDTCGGTADEDIDTNCFIIGYSGTGWYGVFRGYTIAALGWVPALRVNYASRSETFFGEEMNVDAACGNLGKVSVCYDKAAGYTDINGIFTGEASDLFPSEGKPDLFYQHEYYVRDAIVVPELLRATFTSNTRVNFATQLLRIFEFRCEAVPGWYKEYLLAVFFRGNLFINDVATKISELAIEKINDDADLWKPWAKIEKEEKAAFGCELPVCEDPCLCVAPSVTSATLPTAIEGEPYSAFVPWLGTLPATVTLDTAPAWLSAAIVGNQVHFTGTPPLPVGTYDVVYTIENECGNVQAATTVTIVGDLPCEAAGLDGLAYLPEVQVGAVFFWQLTLTGTAPFTLTNITKPAWLTISVTGNIITFSGTPPPSPGLYINFDVENCGAFSFTFDWTLTIASGLNIFIENNASSGAIVDVTPYVYLISGAGTFPVNPGEYIEGTQGGGNTTFTVVVSGAVF